MRKKIKFGYEIGTGKEVEIPLSHTVITGLTNESGKTTAIMGLIKGSGFKALIIKTKIGEKAITEGTIIPPFYKEVFDWEYAAELLESSRKEKLKFERSWIIRYSKNANSILEFKRNIDNALAEGKLRELDKSVLISLQAYLEKILPELQYAPLSKTLDIKEGINIMDLERFKEETQGIIIKSVLEEVLKNEKKVIIIIPEAWKYLPEKLATPVKRPAEAFIRQGASNEDFLFLDSQDITGVSKSILKQVSNWILGYQREINEIERTLDQIPLSKKEKPKPEEIATLKLGQFFVATSEFVKKCYAQPCWLDDENARKIAKGKLDVSSLEQPTHIAPHQILPTKQEDPHIQARGDVLEGYKKINELREDFISNRNDFFNKFGQVNETISAIYKEIYKITNEPKFNEDEIVMRVLQKVHYVSSSQKPYSQINEEALISKILARVPAGGNVVYKIAPLEKITKDFLEEAKTKILSDVSSLSEDAKKTLKFIESQEKPVSNNFVVGRCFHLLGTNSSHRAKISNALKELADRFLVEKHEKSGNVPRLKTRITELLGVNKATEQEIEQVFNHVLMEMLK